MEKTVISDGVKINYDIQKSNDSKVDKVFFLIFIHGAGGDLNVWKKERQFFHKKGISTLAIDIRGHGKSDKPNDKSKYQLKYFAKDILKIIRTEKIKNFILVGHCLGGIITIIFQKYFPKLAKSYIFIDSTYEAPKILKKFFKYNPINLDILNNNFMNKHIRNSFTHVNHEKFVGTNDIDFWRIYSDITNTSFRSWIFTYESISRFSGIDTVKSINKPVLIIHGDKDIVFNIKVAKRMHHLIRDSILKIIPDENHIIVLNNPEVINNEIFDFIRDKKFI
jgi:pimeloyl-ACP methyl ester carboxylesterase